MHKMKAAVIVFLVASVCIQCATTSKQNIRKKRAWVVDSLSMDEEHSGPFPYKLGDLNIEKSVMDKVFIHGQGIDKDPKGILSVKSNGSVYALGKVDYEEYKRLTFRLTTENTSVAVDIMIQDVNDHAPVFNKEVYEITIDESTPQGERLVTVLANDDDQLGSANSLFTLRIVSVSPQTSNTEFFIDQTEADVTGTIYFKGCLDYEETQKYTILVEAKDHGEKVQLSSTSTVILNIIDKNNHLPEFTGTTASSWVKEKSGEPVCRLQVTDKDSRGSAAWRARYSLRGDEAKHFKIQTDPDTNDGVITVADPLNYEEMSNLNLTVIVENEEPFFYCRVTGRPKHGLWGVQHSRGRSSSTSATLLITNMKNDDSEPSVFVEMVKHERLETGPMLEAFKLGMCLSEKSTEITAVDPDLYGPSLHFELMGDVEGEWRLLSNYGTARLMKESAVRAGDHELTLKISDSRGRVSLQSLSVRVCDCEVSADCHVLRGPAVFQLSATAIAAVIVSLLLLLGMVLMAFQIRRSASPSYSSSNLIG